MAWKILDFFEFLPVKKIYAREKFEKTLQKCAWKSLFPRENFGKSHAWKPLFKHVKNIAHYTCGKENMPVKKNNIISVKIPIQNGVIISFGGGGCSLKPPWTNNRANPKISLFFTLFWSSNIKGYFPLFVKKGFYGLGLRVKGTGVLRENPQGVWFFSRLASAEESGKEPHPPTFLYKKNCIFFYFDKRRTEGGFFFSASLSWNRWKKTPPPGGFPGEPL